MVFVERGQRKILVNYAKRQVGNKVYGGQSLAPAAEAEHVGRDPADLRLARSSCCRPRWSGWFATGEGMRWLKDLVGGAVAGPADLRAAVRGDDRVLLLLLHGAGVQQPSETADNLKKSGAFIPGIRPGDQTAQLHRQASCCA
ncbi:MAG: hypothetical protein MZW92_20660 [Comamonadaceae bacterium]|nr:hypothetical protein [Comamonadaceae bacterium]